MKQNLHVTRIETLSLQKHPLGRFFWIVTLLRNFEGAEFQTSCFQYGICGYLVFVLTIIPKMLFFKFWNTTKLSISMRLSLYWQVCNYMSWTHISNIKNNVKNTFLTILILRMYIVDRYYYSNGIFTYMLADARVSCFTFSIGSINSPIFTDSGSEVSPDRETPRKQVTS